MNYLNIYNKLIEKRLNDILTKDYHKHHIVPKCVGGSDDLSNIVRLTYREHYIAHILLAKAYPNNYSLQCAVHRMKYTKEAVNYKFNSYVYDSVIRARNKLCAIHSKDFMRGKSVFKHIETGETKILNTSDELVLNGTYVGVNYGKKLHSELYSNRVSVKTIDGEYKSVSMEEYKSNDNLVGVNYGKTGLWDTYNKLYNSMNWYDKLMFSSYKKTKIKLNSKILFSYIFELSKYVSTYFSNHENRISFDYIDMKSKFPNLFYKKVDKPLYLVLNKLRSGWKPETDIEFLESLKKFNHMLEVQYNESN